MVSKEDETMNQIVTPAEWRQARERLLRKEKDATHLRDQLAAERRQLPWVRVDKPYLFTGPDGQQSLASLFEGRRQLAVYHFMFGPRAEEGCRSCSMAADHIDRSALHLRQRGVTLLAVSSAPYPKLAAFKERMGWGFKWVSSYGTDFNHDFKVSFTADELAGGQVDYNYGLQPATTEERHGLSVFARSPEDEVFHTYSSYGRGVEELLGVYTYLDMVPAGRAEQGLPYPMAWVRHHDRYEE
jgi:predicted dithiol-disulfide oxidoreductase (DUF899 family)